MNKKVLGAVVVAAIVLVGGALFINDKSNLDKIANSDNGSKGSIEITHQLGTTKFEKTPEKVVVLDYGMLDVLDGLGIDILGLPKSGNVPEYLNKYTVEEYVDAGTIKEPNLEAINEIDPDVIIITGRMQDYYDQLSQIAPTVFVQTGGAEYLNEFTDGVNMMAQIFGEEKDAKKMIEEITEKIDDTKKKVVKQGLKATTVMVNGRGISVFGADSRFGILYNDLGFGLTDTELDAATHGQEVTFEYLAEKNPQLLFVVDRNAITGTEEVTAEEVIENELTKQTDAYKNGKITYLNPVNWYIVSGGYQSTLSMIEEVNSAIK